MSDRPGFLLVFGAVFLLCVHMVAVFLYGAFATAVSAPEPITVEVLRGEPLTRVARRLGEANILRDPALLRALAVLRGDSARIKAGEYILKGEISPNELLDYFVSGRARFISLTIPEGFSLRDIAARVETLGVGPAAEFLRIAKDPEFIAAQGLPGNPEVPSLEGFAFPETYYLHRGFPMERLLTSMVGQFKRQAQPLVEENAKKVRLTPYEVMVLASIIEKETGLAEERRLISAVFHNRLKAGMRLMSDPTVIYGIETFDGNLTRTHLRTSTLYNTYKIFGLPPTPIANPGVASVVAALNPAKVSYLYFVAKGDGSHVFSKDLKTHNRAVWKYQKRRNGKRSL